MRLAAEVAMRRPTLAGVPAMPALAAPLASRHAGLNDAAALARLLGRALEGEVWEPAHVEGELLCDPTVRGTLVVASGERLIATASWQVRPDAPERAWVRWVATDPDRRREGLARTLLVGVLAMAIGAGCRDARLGTRTDRLAAIRLYLRLGFEPVVTSDADRDAWAPVLSALGR
jgi:mycothiol synthase